MTAHVTRRVAVVTGAARGIGAAVATRLASDGLDVAVVDLSASASEATVAAVEARGGRGLALAADVADESAVAAAIARIAEQLGPPIVLVNNAGIMRNSMMFKMSLDDWRAVLDVHLTGAFLMSRAVQQHMVAARYGRIVNVASIAVAGFVGQANYASAKAGLIGLTRTLALELGRYSVTVNAVAPGFTVTDMTRGVAAEVGTAFEDMEQAMVKRIPVGRPGHPDDIAHAVSFLADERSGFVSGQVLYVAGGPVGSP